MMYSDENAPVLLVMAAGMGSRYGGLKQMDPVGLSGELIMDFSVYDAMRAGFKKVVFIIKKEMEEDFRAVVEKKAGRKIETEYVMQSLENVPEGFSPPAGRVKPWGTGHAVLSAANSIHGPFAVINADDFYGAHAFQTTYDFLANPSKNDVYPFCMVCYNIENTLSETGYVSRGICALNEEDYLIDITERVHIEKKDKKIIYQEDENTHWTELLPGTPVSMNLWGFSHEMMGELANRFIPFLQTTLKENPEKGEYFLPSVVNELLKERKACVKALKTPDKWHGVTNKEDKKLVSEAICNMQKKGIYPEKLWV